MTCDARDSNYDSSDVVVCVGIVLMSVGVTTLGVAYLFPIAGAASPVDYSARETESAELRVWTAFTVFWTVGLALTTLSVVIISCTLIYTNCCGHRVTSSDGDVMSLHTTQRRYGSSDNEWTRGHQ